MLQQFAILIIMLHFLFTLASAQVTSSNTSIVPRKSFSQANNTAKTGCQTKCGDLVVPYPFGIGFNCSINPRFDVICNESFSSAAPRAFTYNGNHEIVNIADDHIQIKNLQVANTCRNGERRVSMNFTDSPYSFSNSNRFTTLGCDYAGGIVNISGNVVSSCTSYCFNGSDPREGEGQCMGIGCCQTDIPKGLQAVNISVTEAFNVTFIDEPIPCGYVFLRDQEYDQFQRNYLLENDFQNRSIEDVPIVIDWVIGNQTCEQARQSADYACQENSDCVEDPETGLGGYRCNCSEGFEGNSYLSPGCTDINECESNPCAEHAICTNTVGSYSCSCKQGYDGDGLKSGGGCSFSQSLVIKLVIGSSVGILAVLLGLTWLHFFTKRRKLEKMREQFFLKNGGFILKQKTSLENGGSTKIFSAQELEKATNNYSEDCIVGRGGYGTVYRAILSDQLVVAVKKSRIMGHIQIESFINEVIILTQINHRNIVKLLGCCLETEVPLLVYEFISNGTLYHHIHHNGESPWFSWKDRLRIAAEAAGALAYLHSAASMPIIHRDVKSSNILLDDSYTAKISDFGASRLIPLGQTQVTTLVQGTLGYLDPGYFQTSQLTEKSDVYSFGVVLAELMTGMRPLSASKLGEEMNLATYFITSLNENRLFEILEPRVQREGSLDQLMAVGELVNRCLCLKGDERPTMKEVAMELEGLRRYTKHPWTEQGYAKEETEVLLSYETGLPSDLVGSESSDFASDLHMSTVGSEMSTGVYFLKDGRQIVRQSPR